MLTMKFFLLIDENEAGPYEPEEIRIMLAEGKITGATLGLPENRTIDWLPIYNFPKITGTAVRHEPATENRDTINSGVAHQTEELLSRESSIESSDIAGVLSNIAFIEIVAAPIVGIAEGSGAGVIIFICGFTGGLILLGFARVIEHSNEGAQRLRRIESLLMKASSDKKSS